jgi:hypothetical protein
VTQTAIQPDPFEAPSEPPRVRIEFLDPEAIRFERTDHGSLRMTIADGKSIDHVLVYRTHPLSMPREYIAVRVGRSELEQKELGIIRDMADLRAEDCDLIEDELQKRYFIHTVTSIISVREEMGYFYWIVETDKGRREFPVPIRPRHIKYVRPRGRVIIDIDGNRYGIRDLAALDPVSQAMYHRHIYW